MSSSNCCFLTCIQVSQEAGQLVWYSHLLKNFPQFIVIHTVKGFGIVNKAEIDVFLELSCFFDDPVHVGNLMSGSSSFSKTSLNIRKFTVHVLLKPSLENFEQYFTSVWDECNCAVVWAFFGIAFLWDWNENWHFPVLWPLLSFPNLLAYWVQHFHSTIFISSCYSLELCIQTGKFPFLFCFSLLFFSQLFVRLPQTAILLFFISFSWGWSWSLSPLQCNKPLTIVLQVLCLSDLVP